MKTTYKLFLASVVTLMIATTTLTFGYWWSDVQGDLYKDDAPSINIGTGDVLNTTFSIGTGSPSNTKSLVPEGRVNGDTNRTSEIVITYNVTWTPDADDSGNINETEYLKVTLNSIKNASNVELKEEEVTGGYSLFDVSYRVFHHAGSDEVLDKSIKLSDSPSDARLLRIYIKLREPSGVLQYDKVAGQVITFSINVQLVEAPLSEVDSFLTA